MEYFDRDKAAATANWILKDYTFGDESLRGLEQLLPLVESDKDVEELRGMEMERLLRTISLYTDGMGNFREQFEAYIKSYYQS